MPIETLRALYFRNKVVVNQRWCVFSWYYPSINHFYHHHQPVEVHCWTVTNAFLDVFQSTSVVYPCVSLSWSSASMLPTIFYTLVLSGKFPMCNSLNNICDLYFSNISPTSIIPWQLASRRIQIRTFRPREIIGSLTQFAQHLVNNKLTSVIYSIKRQLQ